MTSCDWCGRSNIVHLTKVKTGNVSVFLCEQCYNKWDRTKDILEILNA